MCGPRNKRSSKNGLETVTSNSSVSVGDLTEFTLEASFLFYDCSSPANKEQTVFGRDGMKIKFGIISTTTTGYTLILSFKDNTEVQTTITGSSILKCNNWYRTAFVGRKTKAVPTGITLEHEMLLYLFDDKAQRWRLEGVKKYSGTMSNLGSTAWTVCRGHDGTNPNYWFAGLVDEVKLSTAALAPGAGFLWDA